MSIGIPEIHQRVEAVAGGVLILYLVRMRAARAWSRAPVGEAGEAVEEVAWLAWKAARLAASPVSSSAVGQQHADQARVLIAVLGGAAAHAELLLAAIPPILAALMEAGSGPILRPSGRGGD